MPESPPSDTESYALGAVFLLVAAVGLCVAGVILLVTCEASSSAPTFGQTTTTCSYPFQGWGSAFLYLGALTALGSCAMFFRFRALRGFVLSWDYRVFLVAVAVGVTVVFFLATLTLGMF